MITNDKYKAIADLDFSAVKLKMTHPTFGHGWSQHKVDAVEQEYRRFLYLHSAFPGEQMSPTHDVDTFWHYHILDTIKYAADCEQIFGYFLHHCPDLDQIASDELDVEVKAGKRTQELYEATFAECYIRAQAAGQEPGAVQAALCQSLCTLVAPQTTGVAAALCQSLCTLAVAPRRSVQNALCQSLCTAAKSKNLRAASALCQSLCTAAAPTAKDPASIRSHELSPRLPCRGHASENELGQYSPIVPARIEKYAASEKTCA